MSKDQLCVIVSKYNAYVDAHPHIEELILECDVNHDGVMDEFEMKNLLEVSKTCKPYKNQGGSLK